MNRREVLRTTPLSLFGLGTKRKYWFNETSMIERRQELMREFGNRNAAELPEIIADLILRIEALESPL